MHYFVFTFSNRSQEISSSIKAL